MPAAVIQFILALVGLAAQEAPQLVEDLKSLIKSLTGQSVEDLSAPDVQISDPEAVKEKVDSESDAEINSKFPQ